MPANYFARNTASAAADREQCDIIPGFQGHGQRGEFVDELLGAETSAAGGESGEFALAEPVGSLAASLDEAVGVEQKCLPRAQPHTAGLELRVPERADKHPAGRADLPNGIVRRV